MKADFSKNLGPQPGDPPAYEHPADAAPLVPLADTDAATVCTIRRELAQRQARLYARERGE